MCELYYKESWAPKNWCFWSVVLEKTLEIPLDCKEIQPVHPKGDQFWVFIWRTDLEAETAILWPPNAKRRLIWKDPDAGKDGVQEEKGTTEDEMVGWHHRLDGRGFGWTLGVGDGQGSLACCSSWGRKESDMSQQLNWTELPIRYPYCVTNTCTNLICLSSSKIPFLFPPSSSHPHHCLKHHLWSHDTALVQVFEFLLFEVHTPPICTLFFLKDWFTHIKLSFKTF